MIDGAAGGILQESDSGRSIGLGIAINEEGGLLSSCEAGSEVDCGCGLTYPTLLVSNGDDPSQYRSPDLAKLAEPSLRRKMFHVEHRVNCGNSIGKWLFHVEQSRVELDGIGKTHSILPKHKTVSPSSFHMEHYGGRTW